MTDTQSWVDKYRPETFSDIQGNNSDLKEIKKWADNWSVGDDPVLLVGPPGVGKTTTAEAVANRLDVQIVEINASSARKKADIEEMAQSIQSVGGDERRVILLDEVDSWHSGVRKEPLYDALEHPANPVIMTANDEYDTAGGLKSRSEMYEFSLGVRSRKAKLKEIAEAESLDIESHEIKKLAERPDLRSAINDMQIAAEQELPPGSDNREWDLSEFDMLDQVLTGTPDIGSVSPPDALMWIDEPLSEVYRGLEMSMAYDALSLADVELRNAQEGSYRHWRYARAIIEQVANIRQTEPYYGDQIGYNVDKFPTWFRHSEPKPDADNPESKLYSKLKNREGGSFEFKGNFAEFLKIILPMLRDFDDEEKYELIMHYGLEADEYDALNVTQDEYESWAVAEGPTKGEWGGTTESASDW
jgi:replication factor C large subunit